MSHLFHVLCLSVSVLLITSCASTETIYTPRYVGQGPSGDDGAYSNDYAGSNGYGADYVYSSTYYGTRPYWINRFSPNPTTAVEVPAGSAI